MEIQSSTGPSYVNDPSVVIDSALPTEKTEAGFHSEKVGALRINPKAWSGDPLSKWRGLVDGKTPPLNVLSNPARTDGLAIPRGADPDGVFIKQEARVPHRKLAYTEGNNWPNANGGAVPGSNILPIENNAGGGVLFAGSMTPGYEQAGAALTPVKAGSDSKFVPTPAFGWLESVGLSQYSQPQVWIAKLNMDPGNVEGWHESGARPNDDPAQEDHGTPPFPYGVIVRDQGPGEAPVFSFSSSEGYDPAITGEPGYGMMLVATVKGKDQVVSALSIQDVTDSAGTGVTWSDPAFGFGSFLNDQGGVTTTGAMRSSLSLPTGETVDGVTYRLVLEKPGKVDALLAEKAKADPDSVVSATHISVPDGF